MDNLKGLEALCYLDDIAHGRKMNLDAQDLKLIIEKELKALEIIKKYFHKNNGEFVHWWLEDMKDVLTEKEYKLLNEVLKNE